MGRYPLWFAGATRIHTKERVRCECGRHIGQGLSAYRLRMVDNTFTYWHLICWTRRADEDPEA